MTQLNDEPMDPQVWHAEHDPGTDAQPTELKRTLKNRHTSMIALGGVIGAGLFIGSGNLIVSTGPIVVFSFLLAGLLAALVLRMLAEMAINKPITGSFYEYARVVLGDRAGFITGWTYWYFWVVVIAFEVSASTALLKGMIPGVPSWIIGLAILIALTVTNLFSTKSFAEFEYWFAMIKVVAITAFILVAVIYISGLINGADGRPFADGLANWTAGADGEHGGGWAGFAPLGIIGMLIAVVPATGFFSGAEIATMAAAEAEDPENSVRKSTRSVIYRVLLFYVGSMLVILTITPWSKKTEIAGNIVGWLSADAHGPYAGTLITMGITWAGIAINILAIVAVLSSINSALYVTGRTMFALTRQGHAPKALTTLSKTGVPRRAVLLATVLGYLAVLIDHLVGGGVVLDILLHSYGALALVVYAFIAASQIRMRRRMEKKGEVIKMKMWLFPYASYFALFAMIAVILAMAILPSTRLDFTYSMGSLAVIAIAYEFNKRYRKKHGVREHQVDI